MTLTPEDKKEVKDIITSKFNDRDAKQLLLIVIIMGSFGVGLAVGKLL